MKKSRKHMMTVFVGIFLCICGADLECVNDNDKV